MSVSLHKGFSIQQCQSEDFSYHISQQISSYANLINEAFMGIKLDLLGVAVEKSVAFAAIAVGMLRRDTAIAYIPRTTPTEAWSVAKQFRVSAIITDAILEGPARPNRTVYVPDLGTFYVYVLDNTLTFCRRNKILFVTRTSGTTGAPKIVHVPYASIKRNVDYYAANFLDAAENHPILWSTSLTFDPSFVELYTAIVHGAVLMIPDASWYDTTVWPVSSIMKYIHISFLHMTPTKLLTLSNAKVTFLLTNVKHLLVGGEAFPVAFFKQFSDIDIKAKIYNIYGITELSCWASIRLVPEGFAEMTVDIGDPFPNTSVNVVDGKVVIAGPKCFVNFTSVEEITTEDDATEEDGVIFVLSRLKLRGVRMTNEAVRCVLETDIPYIIHACLTDLYHVTILVVVVNLKPNEKKAIEKIEEKCFEKLEAEVEPLQCPVCVVGLSSEQLTTNQNGKTDFEGLINKWLEPKKCLLILKNMGIDVNCPMDTKLSTMGLDSLQIVELSNLLMTVFRSGTVGNISLVRYFQRPDTTVGDVINMFGIYEKGQHQEFKMPANVVITPWHELFDRDVKTWPVDSCVDGPVYSFQTRYVTATVEGNIAFMKKDGDTVDYFKTNKTFFSQPQTTGIYIGNADGKIYKFISAVGVDFIANVEMGVTGTMLLHAERLYIPCQTSYTCHLVRLDLKTRKIKYLNLASPALITPSIQGGYLHLPCAREYVIISLTSFLIVGKLALSSPILRDQFYWRGYLLSHAFLGKVYIASTNGRIVRECGVLPPATAPPVVFDTARAVDSDIWCLPLSNNQLFIVRATLTEDDGVRFDPLRTLEISNISGFLHAPVKFRKKYWIVMSSTGQIFVADNNALVGSQGDYWRQLDPISEDKLEVMGVPKVYGSSVVFGSRNDAVFEIDCYRPIRPSPNLQNSTKVFICCQTQPTMFQGNVNNEEGFKPATADSNSSAEVTTTEVTSTIQSAEMATLSSLSLASLPTATTSTNNSVNTLAEMASFESTILKSLPTVTTSTTSSPSSLTTSTETNTAQSTMLLPLRTPKFMTALYDGASGFDTKSAEIVTIDSVSLQSLPTLHTSMISAPIATFVSEKPASLPTVPTSIVSTQMATIVSEMPASLPTDTSSIHETTEAATLIANETVTNPSDALATDGSNDTLELNIYAPPTDPDDTISSIQSLVTYSDEDGTLQSVRSVACVSEYSTTTTSLSSLASLSTASMSSNRVSAISTSSRTSEPSAAQLDINRRRHIAANILMYMNMHFDAMSFTVTRSRFNVGAKICDDFKLFLGGFYGRRFDQAYSIWFQTVTRQLSELTDREFYVVYGDNFNNMCYVLSTIKTTQPAAFIQYANPIHELFNNYSHKFRFGCLGRRCAHPNHRRRSHSCPPIIADDIKYANKYLDDYLHGRENGKCVYNRFKKSIPSANTV
uniref:AMP-binding domain-containing protein n=1 Tax=Panagrellus redivivus TaxID=6233 RepID=A0A7E4VXX0_PANRE